MSNDFISINGLYCWNPDVFDDLVVPDDVDEDAVIFEILAQCSELELLYPDWGFMKKAIGMWSEKNLENWQRVADALSEEYDPLHNFDRHEDNTDTETRNLAGSDNTTTSTSGNAGGTTTDSGQTTVENQVTGFNTTTPQTESKQITNPGGSTTTSSTSTTSGTANKSTTDTGTVQNARLAHMYGNIGVTKSQEMLRDEVDLRGNDKMTIIDVIANSFKMRFCILVY